jgi:hypothetical protein
MREEPSGRATLSHGRSGKIPSVRASLSLSHPKTLTGTEMRSCGCLIRGLAALCVLLRNVRGVFLRIGCDSLRAQHLQGRATGTPEPPVSALVASGGASRLVSYRVFVDSRSATSAQTIRYPSDIFQTVVHRFAMARVRPSRPVARGPCAITEQCKL